MPINLTSILGIVLAAATTLFAFDYFNSGTQMFWQPVQLLTVLLGSTAITLISFRFMRVWILFGVFFNRISGTNKKDNKTLIADIGALARARRLSVEKFSETRKGIRDYFLRDATGLLEWTKAEISGIQLRELLNTRSETVYSRYLNESEVFRKISTFPAKVGFLISSIAVSASLVQLTDDATTAEIASAIGLNLASLIYGIIISLFVLRPIAENLREAAQEDHISRMIVVEGIMMMFEGLPPQFIEEKVKSFLLPAERMQLSQNAAGQ